MNTLSGAEGASSPSFPPPVGLGLGLAPCLPWVPTEWVLYSPGPDPNQRGACLCSLALPAGSRRSTLCLGSPQGRVRAGAVRGCNVRAGPARAAAHCGRGGWWQTGSRVGALHRPGGFQGCRLGGSEDAAGEVRHAARPGRDPVPSLLGTRAHLRLAQGLFCASETSGGSNGAVPQALMTRTWSRQTSVLLVCPGHGACWSTSGSDLCSTIVPLAEQVLSWKTHWKGVCFGGFLCICMPGFCR